MLTGKTDRIIANNLFLILTIQLSNGKVGDFFCVPLYIMCHSFLCSIA